MGCLDAVSGFIG